MTTPVSTPPSTRRFGAGWELIVALLVLLAMNYIAGDNLTTSFLPTDFLFDDEEVAWLAWLAVLATFPIIAVVLWLAGARTVLRWVAFVAAGLFTMAVILNAVWLVYTLTERAANQAFDLLWDAALVWGSNVVVFTVWYWLLDAGGSEARASASPRPRDFLFANQTSELPEYPDWRPNFIDYLFLSFCSCTAFSPADTATVSRRAKLMQMLQASLSLLVLAMIAARAINIIQSAPDPAPATTALLALVR